MHKNIKYSENEDVLYKLDGITALAVFVEVKFFFYLHYSNLPLEPQCYASSGDSHFMYSFLLKAILIVPDSHCRCLKISKV